MARLVPINDKKRLEEHSIYNGPAVLRKWFSTCRFPRLIVKVGRRLHVDLDEWDAICDAAKDDARRRAERHEHAMRGIERV
jgi:hypothetical protein